MSLGRIQYVELTSKLYSYYSSRNLLYVISDGGKGKQCGDIDLKEGGRSVILM